MLDVQSMVEALLPVNMHNVPWAYSSQAWLASQHGLLLCRWYCHAQLVDPFLDSHGIDLQELYSSQVWIKLFLDCVSLAIWDFTLGIFNGQAVQTSQTIYLRMVQSDGLRGAWFLQAVYLPNQLEEVWQVKWAASCSPSPLIPTYSHCGLSSPVLLSDFQLYQMDRTADMALQEDLDVGSA